MKKAGEILKEMGFRKDAPASLQEAFVRHLIKAAGTAGDLASPESSEAGKVSRLPVQLEFSFEETKESLAGGSLPQKKSS